MALIQFTLHTLWIKQQPIFFNKALFFLKLCHIHTYDWGFEFTCLVVYSRICIEVMIIPVMKLSAIEELWFWMNSSASNHVFHRLYVATLSGDCGRHQILYSCWIKFTVFEVALGLSCHNPMYEGLMVVVEWPPHGYCHAMVDCCGELSAS